jgi:hypothetical protein
MTFHHPQNLLRKYNTEVLAELCGDTLTKVRPEYTATQRMYVILDLVDYFKNTHLDLVVEDLSSVIEISYS